jgi:sensor histidine kinase YesM
MKGRRSLKSNINVVVFAVVSIMIVMQIWYVVYLSALLNEQKQHEIRDIVSYIGNTIEKQIERAKMIQDTFAKDTDVHEFLFNSEFDDTLFPKIRSKAYQMGRYIQDNAMITLISNEGAHYALYGSMSPEETEQVNGLISRKNDYRDVDFFEISENDFQIIYMCSFTPIEVYDFKQVGVHNAGMCVVLTKINIPKIIVEGKYDERLILSFSSSYSGTQKPITFHINTGESKNFISDKRMIQGTMWQLTGDMEFNKDTSVFYRLQMIIIAEIIIFIIGSLFLQFMLKRNIAEPITELASFLNAYKMSSSRKRFAIVQNREFVTISNHINQLLEHSETMTRQIVSTQQRLYEVELGEKNALIYALQSQINPHFLHNTLDAMAGIAVVNEQQELYKMAIILSDIFRYSLGESHDVTVADEVEITEKFIALQHIRFNGRFDVEFDISDDIWDVSMLRLLLQPIVENSFKHGLMQNGQKGFLKITGCANGDHIELSVTDNGNGMPNDKYMEFVQRLESEKLEYITGSNVGLLNINNRIKMYYGQAYGVSIHQQAGEYMRVTIRLPNSTYVHNNERKGNKNESS